MEVHKFGHDLGMSTHLNACTVLLYNVILLPLILYITATVVTIHFVVFVDRNIIEE